MAKKLSAIQVKKAVCPSGRKQVKLHDGNNMFLLVRSNQTKTWFFRYRRDGKEQQLSLGRYGIDAGCVDLSEARKRARGIRALLDAGQDPALERRQKREAMLMKAKEASLQTIVFETIAEQWFAKTREDKGWTQKHVNKLRVWLRRDIYPAFGGVHPDKIEAPDILAITRRAEASGYFDKAHGVKQTIHRIFSYPNFVTPI